MEFATNHLIAVANFGLRQSEFFLIVGLISFVFLSNIFTLLWVMKRKKKLKHFLDIGLAQELNLEKNFRESPIKGKQKVPWFKGKHMGREYWLTFFNTRDYSVEMGRRQQNPRVTILTECKSQSPETVFKNLGGTNGHKYKESLNKGQWTLRLISKLMAPLVKVNGRKLSADEFQYESMKQMKENIGYYSEGLSVAPYKELFHKDPLPPFNAQGKWIIKKIMDGAFPPKSSKILSEVEKVMTASK